jgi:hypothetical protein
MSVPQGTRNPGEEVSLRWNWRLAGGDLEFRFYEFEVPVPPLSGILETEFELIYKVFTSECPVRV